MRLKRTTSAMRKVNRCRQRLKMSSRTTVPQPRIGGCPPRADGAERAHGRREPVGPKLGDRAENPGLEIHGGLRLPVRKQQDQRRAEQDGEDEPELPGRPELPGQRGWRTRRPPPRSVCPHRGRHDLAGGTFARNRHSCAPLHEPPASLTCRHRTTRRPPALGAYRSITSRLALGVGLCQLKCRRSTDEPN